MTIHLTYSRAKRQWEAHNGRFADDTPIATGPPGQAGKLSAIQQAIQQCNPALADMASRATAKWPDSKRRIWKAALRVANGGVQPVTTDTAQFVDEVARLPALQGDGVWILLWSQRPYCSCPDAFTAPLGPKGHPWCTHAFAYVFYRLLQEQPVS